MDPNVYSSTPGRREPPPSTDLVLSQWQERVPSLPTWDWPADDDVATCEIRQQYESLSISYQSTWKNPYQAMYSPNPFEWKNAPGYHGYLDPLDRSSPWVHREGKPDPEVDMMGPLCESPVPLSQLELTDMELSDVRRIHAKEHVWMFRARTPTGDRILKVFDSHPSFGLRNFNSERQAYTNFHNAGSGVKGYVPHCFGICIVAQDFIQGLQCPTWLKYTVSEEYDGSLHMLVLEYIEGCPLSTRTITVPIATEALKALAAIHDARVLHFDVLPRHLLVAADRVVMIDFDVARTYPHKDVHRLTFWREIKAWWTNLFKNMLPDKRAGIDRDMFHNMYPPYLF